MSYCKKLVRRAAHDPGARIEAARAPWDIAGRTPRTLWEVMRDGWLRRRERQMLTTLEGATMRDMRFHHAELELEANKPFWRLLASIRTPSSCLKTVTSEIPSTSIGSSTLSRT